MNLGELYLIRRHTIYRLSLQILLHPQMEQPVTYKATGLHVNTGTEKGKVWTMKSLHIAKVAFSAERTV